MEHQEHQILSKAAKVALNEQYLAFFKARYPDPAVLNQMYDAGISTNLAIANFPWENVCRGPMSWDSFNSTALYEKPLVYMFFSKELLDFLGARIAAHQQHERFYLFIAAAALTKYIGKTYEGEDRKRAQINAIKRGFKALHEGRGIGDIPSHDRRMFVVASELRQDGEENELYYTCVPVGAAIPSDIVHNLENKTNDWCRKGRVHWMENAGEIANNRKTNPPSLEFFEYLAAEGFGGDAEFLPADLPSSWT